MDNIYLALYSFGFDSPLSMEEKLKTAAEIGYTGVEFAGGYGGLDAAKMKEALARYGLKAVSSHVQAGGVVNDLPFLAGIGAKMAVVPGYPFATRDEALECADTLNGLGREAAKHGLKVGYHNHTSEFWEEGGRPLLDYVIEATDPALVGIELDCGWASAAGADPAAYIRKHAGRVMAVHVKENGRVIGPDKPRSAKEEQERPTFRLDANGKPIIPEEILKKFEEHMKLNVPTGRGIVDWKAVKAAADAQGCGVYIMEREYSYNEPKDRVQCLREDFDYLLRNV